MKFKHYPHDDQLEWYKAKQREKVRLELVEKYRIEQEKKVEEILKNWNYTNNEH